MRIGIGFDAHRFAPGRALVLGTIAVEHEQGLAGHSDGDVLTHAIVDAILGAAGLGDIGTHFPSTDDRWKDADSSVFLAHAVEAARSDRLIVASVDATVICEAPRLEPYREKMQAALASGAGCENLSVKATTTDTMGFTGRGEGIAAIAVALLLPE
jgi:2-C-methyl-D-erythritol 4-phosphate cytidylyltransferase/2-C-methyl-D-erythritol 2,4-cyclodiphosphate synthase